MFQWHVLIWLSLNCRQDISWTKQLGIFINNVLRLFHYIGLTLYKGKENNNFNLNAYILIHEFRNVFTRQWIILNIQLVVMTCICVAWMQAIIYKWWQLLHLRSLWSNVIKSHWIPISDVKDIFLHERYVLRTLNVLLVLRTNEHTWIPASWTSHFTWGPTNFQNSIDMYQKSIGSYLSWFFWLLLSQSIFLSLSTITSVMFFSIYTMHKCNAGLTL